MGEHSTEREDRAAWLALWQATMDVRPLEGDRYTFRFQEETVHAVCVANYSHHTLFEDARGWRFCLTPWEVRRYAL